MADANAPPLSPSRTKLAALIERRRQLENRITALQTAGGNAEAAWRAVHAKVEQAEAVVREAPRRAAAALIERAEHGELATAIMEPDHIAQAQAALMDARRAETVQLAMRDELHQQLQRAREQLTDVQRKTSNIVDAIMLEEVPDIVMRMTDEIETIQRDLIDRMHCLDWLGRIKLSQHKFPARPNGSSPQFVAERLHAWPQNWFNTGGKVSPMQERWQSAMRAMLVDAAAKWPEE
jgi:hypothetical protein